MNKEYFPLKLIAGLIIIQVLFYTFALTIGSSFISGELNGIWFFFSILLFFILGVYAIIKGNTLRKSEETKTIGIITLIAGIIITIPSIYMILIWIYYALVGSPFGIIEA